jgi:hypothetical protein
MLPCVQLLGGFEVTKGTASPMPYGVLAATAGPWRIKLRRWNRRTQLHVGRRFGSVTHAGLTANFSGDGRFGLGFVIEL